MSAELIGRARDVAKYQTYGDIDNLLRALADALETAEADPAKDERLVRFMAMATPLGYQTALTAVQQMTLMIQEETNAERLRADAWDEGAQRVIVWNRAYPLVTPTDNPYRKETT